MHSVFLCGFVLVVSSAVLAQGPQYSKDAIEHGHQYFEQNCAFCHGRDAGGGETGPDLTRSKVVGSDLSGDKIGALVRAGRVDKGMPSFNISDADLAGLRRFCIRRRRSPNRKKEGARG